MPLKLAFAAVAGATFMTAQPLADEDVLEPSVENEVFHALGAAPTNAAPGAVARDEAVRLLAGTNRLSATELAVRLVSSQRADGRWLVGTNDVTAVAVELLENLR
ncbi:MAG: hypothetical protein IJS36_00355 [Kiritimatiellae bacterium]|nr:hypothetical protein [Kiritimatiellia bacterium]